MFFLPSEGAPGAGPSGRLPLALFPLFMLSRTPAPCLTRLTCLHLSLSCARPASFQDAALPLVEALMPHVSKLLDKGRFPGE